MAARELSAAPEPVAEPIVLVIQGQTFVTGPDDPAWLIAYHACERDQQLKLAERDLRGKRALIAELRKNKKREEELARETHNNREAIERIFDCWRLESGHKNCKLTGERFDAVAARFAEDYDEGHLTMAVIGVAINPYIIEGERKDDFRTAVRTGEAVERYANRCPADRRRELSGRLFEVEA